MLGLLLYVRSSLVKTEPTWFVSEELKIEINKYFFRVYIYFTHA